MKTLRLLHVICVTCVILAAGVGYETANANEAVGWSLEEKVPGYLDDTFPPFLLADQSGNVHAFTSQWVGNQERKLAIVYRKWSLMGGWTRPVDIILSPTDSGANFMWAYLDSANRIHVIFSATAFMIGYVFYSSAPAESADQALAWSTPLLVGSSASGLNSGAIIGDDQGNLVIIYSGNPEGSGVYSLYSKDSGKEWSDTIPVYLTYDNKLSPFSLRLTIGPEQKIRAAWNVVTNLGVDESLYFANFDLNSYKWDLPVELDEMIDLPNYFGPSFPAIVDNGREVVLLYNSGNPFADSPVGKGRPIQISRISTDGGLTWSEPLAPFPYHLGRSGEHTVVLDGEGVAHTLFIQRIERAGDSGEYFVVGGIWHSVFKNGFWSNPDRFVTEIAPHDVRAAVVQGNVLLAVWRQDPGLGNVGIWYSYTVLDVPELPLATLPVDESTVEEVVAAIPEPLTPEPSPQPYIPEDAPRPIRDYHPALPIVIGAIPVALILIGVVLRYRFLARRRE